MSKKEINPVILTHCDKLFEADMIVSALEDAGVPAYHSPTKSAASTIIPQAMGLNENGYDVCVLENKLEAAQEILKGITVSDDTESLEENEFSDEEISEVPEFTAPETSVENKKGEAAPGAGIGPTILTLALVAAAVWLSDLFVAWIQSLLGCS